MKVKLVHIDGRFPNLALMRIGAYYKNRGDEVTFTRSVNRYMYEPEYDLVMGSSIFKFSENRIKKLRSNYPEAIIGGTGTDNWSLKAEEYIGDSHELDYSFYPEYKNSIGFTQRGCRLKCKFCVVPIKEGKNHQVNSIADIYRGSPYPKNIHLLDNDFFGQPEEYWKARIKELQEGNFKVSFSQGINIRMINEEVAEQLATLNYRDDQFTTKRIYTAWDSIGDENRFFKGVDLLADKGIEPKHIMALMLIGYDKKETWERIWYRFNKIVDRGVLPYPMVYDPLQQRRDLKLFQRYAVRRYYKHKTYDEFLDFYYGGQGKPSKARPIHDENQIAMGF